MELFKSRTRVAYTNAVGDKVYPVVVDIKKGIKSTEDIQFVSSDVNTGILSVAFISGNENFNVSGADVVCSVMRPDASTLELPCEVVRENIVEVPLGINGTSQDGVYSFDFKVLKGGNKIVGTPIMNYSVSLSIGNDMVIEEDDRLPILTMLMTQVNELKDETRETVNQANVATEASREATTNAIEATNNANAVSERVSQETATAISEIKRDTENAIASMNQNTSTAISTMNQSTTDAIDSMNQSTTDAIANMTQKTTEAVTRVNDNLANINNVVTTKVAELDTAKSDMTNTVSNKINEVETRFNTLTSKQQQDAEVIDARDGETSLKARLDRDIEKAKQVYVNVEGSHISTDSSDGYAKDVEILGNTIQSASNLADIRSVGDKVKGQELYEIPVVSCGKNLFDGKLEVGYLSDKDGTPVNKDTTVRSVNFIKLDINKTYKITNDKGYSTVWYFYDANYNFISQGSMSTRPSNCVYVKFRTSASKNENDVSAKFQIEEGTVATPYEPYQEDKLTILSPVQLEKVGDVADRIICKDGVWGVEKNVGAYIFDTSLLNLTFEPGNANIQYYTENILPNALKDVNSINNINSFCPSIERDFRVNCKVISCWNTTSIAFAMPKELYPTITDFKNSIPKEIEFKYKLAEPQFIPLPHSQQIKLRTFASKTNISFGCEIEGTIKAQVPKSLGATVNTHTEQINNLNKELDRVKKLEESTVSTVTTESDFTTVEATSNGYFEDVKLEGKTLVNVLLSNTKVSNDFSTHYPNWGIIPIPKESVIFKENITYTFVVNITKNTTNSSLSDAIWFGDVTGGNICYTDDIKRFPCNVGQLVFTIKTVSSFEGKKHAFSYQFTRTIPSGVVEFDVTVLEGDHTQNPPSYFEGLKSVGDGVDEVSVESVNENLFDIDCILNEDIFDKSLNSVGYWSVPIKLKPNMNYTFVRDNTLGYQTGASLKIDNMFGNYSTDNWFVANHYDGANKTNITLNSNQYGYIYLYVPNSTSNILTLYNILKDGNFRIVEGTTPKPYIPHQSDKKRLLYYNEETQTWEKPILRQWDSIEKHANGKYYYHQRSGEVVFDGSESWFLYEGINLEQTLLFGLTLDDYLKHLGNNTLLADKVKCNVEILDDVEGIFNKNSHIKYNTIGFKILKSKLTTQDVQGFKQWLQANNVTVVYQLAQEKVYECTNIDLITYANETNYVVNSGAIVPKTTLKVHNNISNVVSLLQKKVSLLESNVKASQEVQDMMILETDMRMLDIELALMEFMPMKLNLGGSDMLRSATYFNFLKNHIINETYEKEYLENVMNKYLATGRINQDEYDELYKMLYPPVYDIELPIER